MCKLYHQAEALHAQGVHVVSTDEKTGIQALERIHPNHPMEPGKVELVEFEYERHGTQALIANFEVATGQVISPRILDTRTEHDFANHIRQTVATDPKANGYSSPTNSIRTNPNPWSGWSQNWAGYPTTWV